MLLKKIKTPARHCCGRGFDCKQLSLGLCVKNCFVVGVPDSGNRIAVCPADAAQYHAIS